MTNFTLPDERRIEILAILANEGRIKVPDLSRRLDVSVDTIRRDLIELEQSGQLSRVHGGALPKSPPSKPYKIRKQEQQPIVSEIACLTTTLLKNDQVIFLDSGTTTLEIARQLPDTLAATIITPSPHVLLALSDKPNIRAIGLPGVLNDQTMSVTGSSTLDAISKIHADICIAGVCAIHSERGITTNHYEEATLKQQMIKNSSQLIIPATADKIETTVSYTVTGISSVSHLVTEAVVSKKTLSPYEQSGITILKAKK